MRAASARLSVHTSDGVVPSTAGSQTAGMQKVFFGAAVVVASWPTVTTMPD